MPDTPEAPNEYEEAKKEVRRVLKERPGKEISYSYVYAMADQRFTHIQIATALVDILQEDESKSKKTILSMAS